MLMAKMTFLMVPARGRQPSANTLPAFQLSVNSREAGTPDLRNADLQIAPPGEPASRWRVTTILIATGACYSSRKWRTRAARLRLIFNTGLDGALRVGAAGVLFPFGGPGSFRHPCG